jgi:hypothetical protein
MAVQMGPSAGAAILGLPKTSIEALSYITQARPEWSNRFSRCSEAVNGASFVASGHQMLVAPDRCYFFLQDDQLVVNAIEDDGEDDTNAPIKAKTEDTNIPAIYNNAVCFIQNHQNGDICFTLYG